MTASVSESTPALSAFEGVPNLFPNHPPAMFAIRYVREGLVPVGRDAWNRIVENEIPHIRVGNRRVVTTLAVSAWLLRTHKTPGDEAEGSVLSFVAAKEVRS